MTNKAMLPMLVLLAASMTSCGKSKTSDTSSHVPDRAAPNIIIIVADQMRRSAMGFWRRPEYQGTLDGVADPVITPTLDYLAKQGIVFNQAIANYPLCSPFRAMLLSGMYPNKNGVNRNTRRDRPTVGLKLEIDTLTAVLKRSGYNTALFGKADWQNVLPLFSENGVYEGTTDLPGGYFLSISDFDTYIPQGPGRHGVEYWYQTVGHHHDNPAIYSNDNVAINGINDGTPYYPNQYSTVNQADVLIHYIINDRRQRDANKPFAVLWALDPPHPTYQAIADTDEAILNEYYAQPAVRELLNRPNVDVEVAKRYIRIYLSMITLIDREIGRVLQVVNQQGLANNTLVIFTSDHGEMMGSHGMLGKNVVYEESLGIPLIMSLPGKLKHRVDDLLIGVPDLMPTILGLVGLQDQIPGNIDGRNYANYLLQAHDVNISKPKSSLYYGRDSQLGVRTDKYTFAVDKNGQLIALFDNQTDPYQLSPLSLVDIPADDQAFLQSELGTWLEKIDHDWYKQTLNAQIVTYPN
jgi:arylsulfatase A-like enzyme